MIIGWSKIEGEDEQYDEPLEPMDDSNEDYRPLLDDYDASNDVEAEQVWPKKKKQKLLKNQPR